MFSQFELSLIGQSDNQECVEKVLKLDEKLDKEFGLEIEKTEALINSKNPFHYQGLNSNALLTSYLDYYQIFNFIGKDSLLIDVGSGYSRGTLLAEKLNFQCVSIEVVRERVSCTKSVLENKNSLIEADITDPNFELPVAPYYLLYLPHGIVLYEALRKIQKIAKYYKTRIIVIESHGQVIDYLKLQNNWLKLVTNHLKTSNARHNSNIYIFECEKDFKKNELQYHWDWNKDLDFEYIICEDNKSFSLDTYNSEIWIVNNEVMIETKNPVRMFKINNLQQVRKISEQNKNYQKLHFARNTKQKTTKGHLLKIIIAPDERVEWSNGEYSTWDQALKLIE